MDMQQHTTIKDSLKTLRGMDTSVSDSDKDIGYYVSEKTMRITAAVLSVTALMGHDNHLRHALEKTSISLTEKASMSVSTLRARGDLATCVYTLTTLVTTAKLAGQVAGRTADILVQELTALVDFLASVGWVRGERMLRTQLLATEVGSDTYETETYKGPERTAQGQHQYYASPQVKVAGTTTEKDTQRTPSEPRSRAPEHYRDRVQEIQKDRRATILGIMQKKDKVTIRDVSHVIKDCSDKTIQRELLALVKQGVLVKEGERRWSTYSLA